MKRVISFLFVIFTTLTIYAQGFNYKALISENGSVLMNHPVDIRFTLKHDGSQLYQETHSTTTDAHGIVKVEVGDGTPVFGDFSDIDWSTAGIELQVEIDTDGTGYRDFGTETLLYVPYAKFAEEVANAFSGDYNDLINKPVTFYREYAMEPPTDISESMYHLGKVIIGRSYGPTSAGAHLSVFTQPSTVSGDMNGFYNYMQLNATGSFAGIYNDLIFQGTAYRYGVYNNLQYTTSGYGYTSGVKNTINVTGPASQTFGVNNDVSVEQGEATGVYNNILNDGSGVSTGVQNYIVNNSGSGEVKGVFNYLGGTGDLYGMESTFTTSADNDFTGVLNNFEGTGHGDYIGMENQFDQGAGTHVGLINFMQSDNAQYQVGVVNFLENDANSTLAGMFTKVSGSGNANVYAVIDSIINTGNGDHYGFYNYMNGSGTGLKIGVYSKIDPSAGGWHYAIYGEATKAGAFAGYFNGDVRISRKLLANDSGDADVKAYIYGTLNSGGNIDSGASSSGFTAQKLTDYAGHYRITFSDPTIGSNNFIVVITPHYNPGVTLLVNTVKRNGYFEVIIKDIAGNPQDGAFDFVVYRK